MPADALLKATKVHGVYDTDPMKNPKPKMFPVLSNDRFLTDRIGVMESTALTLCHDNRLPIRVFNLKRKRKGNLGHVVLAAEIGNAVRDV